MAVRASRLDTLQTAELAEGVEVHLRVAGPFVRFVAWMTDVLVTLALLLLLYLIFSVFVPVLGDNVTQGLTMLGTFGIWWFYPVLFEAGAKGATLGKRMVGLQVVNEGGTRISVSQAMVRNFVRTFEVILPLVPLVSFFHPRFQRLGDLAAGTLVVYSKARINPQGVAPPPLASVPVNRALTREEEAAILSFRDRSSTWSESRRMELVDHLESLTGHQGPKGVSQLLGMAHWLEDRR